MNSIFRLGGGGVLADSSRPCVLACDAEQGSVILIISVPVFLLTLFACKVFRYNIWLGSCLYMLRHRQAIVPTESNHGI
jgi:hypothetical protein